MKKRGGAKPCVHVHKHMYTRGGGGSGGMLPPKIFDCLVHSQELCIE